jgi:hypothetical protein
MHAILSAGLLTFAITAQAVPNMWSSGFGMGVTEYIITSPENVMMNLNCTGNPDDQNILQHHVMLTLPDGSGADSQDEKTAITVVTDDQTFPCRPLWAGVTATTPGCRSLMPSEKQRRLRFTSTTNRWGTLPLRLETFTRFWLICPNARH